MNLIAHAKPSILHVALICTAVLCYLAVLLLTHPSVFSYSFDRNLITQYHCSQDIPHEPPCKRLFLTDSQIHIAAGYLYVAGEDPRSYNFQHPPLLKYLYGFGTLFFNNPLTVQYGLGIVLLCVVYIFGLRVFGSKGVACLACLLLTIDPLFLDLSSQALLDLGQAVFLLMYIYITLFKPQRYIVSGVVLGLLLASKFWGGSLFFVIALWLHLLKTQRISIAKLAVHTVVALVIFSGVYVRSFINAGGLFNIVFFELKIVKYWLTHSVASLFGSSLILFVSGYVKEWWGTRGISRLDMWSPMWPISLVYVLMRVRAVVGKKAPQEELFLALLVIGYIAYLSFQAPFARYFILILPVLYMYVAYGMVSALGWLRKVIMVGVRH